MPILISYLQRYYEPRDETAYHMCTLPNHYHLIPVRFDICYAEGCWTWESRYAR